jgi:hypothetical protein
MPQIPLYNKGLGPAVRTASGQLSPRASSAAFEQVGLAQAQLGRAVSDVAKVAAEFEIARQDAEVDEIADEYSNTVKDSYRQLNTQPTTSIDEYRDAERTLREGIVAGVDGMAKLGSRQKQVLKDKVNKYADLFSAEGEQAAFTRFLGKASETANKRADSMLKDAVTGTLPVEFAVAEYEEHYNRSINRGYTMSKTPEQFRYALTSERVNLFAMDDSKTLDDVEAEREKIQRGEGEYGGLDLPQRDALASRLGDQLKFLENEAVVAAGESFDDGLALITKATSPAFRSNALPDIQQSIQTMRDLRMPDKALEMEQTLDITLEVLDARDTLRFADTAEVNAYLTEMDDKAREALKSGDAAETARATQAYNKARELMTLRQQEVDADPAKYVNEAFSAVYGKMPTPEQSLQRQLDMGISEPKIRLLTNQQAKEFATSVSEAQSAEEVAQILRFPDKTEGYYLRQLRGAGVGLADMYMSKGPVTLTTDQLFLATRKDAIKIQATPVARQNVRAIVLGDATVQSHMKSMLGGSYADFENRTVRGAVSDTRSGHEARDEHANMLTDLTIFLLQEDGKVITGDLALTPEEVKPYAEAAAEILSEKFSYVETFPNTNTSLRLPAHRAGDAVKIDLGLRETTSSLSADEIFFESNLGNEEGTPEYQMEKDAYVAGVKEGYGWVANNDGVTATLVDVTGGVVFRDDNGVPTPVRVSFDEAITESGARAREVGDIGGLVTELSGQRRALLDGKVTGLELRKLVGTPEHGEAIRRNKEIDAQRDALLGEINRLKRRRSALRRGD